MSPNDVVFSGDDVVLAQSWETPVERSMCGPHAGPHRYVKLTRASKLYLVIYF